VITLLCGVVFNGPASILEDPCCAMLGNGLEWGINDENGTAVTTVGYEDADGVYNYFELDVDCGVPCSGTTSGMGIVMFALSVVQCVAAFVQWRAIKVINNSDMSDVKDYNKRMADPVQNELGDESGPRLLAYMMFSFNAMYCGSPCLAWWVGTPIGQVSGMGPVFLGVSCVNRMLLGWYESTYGGENGFGRDKMERRNEKIKIKMERE
jgi:hypothetical protein